MGISNSANRAGDYQSRRREQRGWYFYDWANSAFSTTVAAVFLGPYLTHVIRKRWLGALKPRPLLGFLLDLLPGNPVSIGVLLRQRFAMTHMDLYADQS